MKGVQGLIIAAAFGIVGGFCNWIYINRLAENKEKVAFVMIDDSAQINTGDRFQDAHFSVVQIPRENVGNLIETAVLWSDRATAVGYPANKAYRGGEILLRQDLQTPGRKDLSEMLAEDEVIVWVSVSSGNIVPEMLNPGNLVSFEVPQIPGGGVVTSSSRELPGQPTELIGPFRILSLGTRTGKREVRRAAGVSSGPEHILAISVRMQEDGEMEPRAARLVRALRLTGDKALRVVLHSAKKEL